MILSSFNPLQVQTKPDLKVSVIDVETGFNPLQVQTKQTTKFFGMDVSEMFQSPIGTNKTGVCGC